MAYAAAHASIHGTVSESLCKQGLYLPLTVPKQAIIREVMAMHPSHRGCQHPLTFTMVSVFDLSLRRLPIQFMAPCLMLKIDKRMLELVRRFYMRNPLANVDAHYDRLVSKHLNRLCTCYYDPDVRHVDARTPAFAA
jgi:hypothetical protein